MLHHVGVIDTLAEQALALGAPLPVALILPLRHWRRLSLRLLHGAADRVHSPGRPAAGTSSLSASGTVAALAIAATVVDVSPFSTDGALVVANARENDRQRVYRQLMTYAGGVWCGPALAWALLVPTASCNRTATGDASPDRQAALAAWNEASVRQATTKKAWHTESVGTRPQRGGE